jgi:AraC family transcriptional regulator of arabinose operon
LNSVYASTGDDHTIGEVGKVIRINVIGYDVTEDRRLLIDRPAGSGDYLFLFFLTPVTIRLQGELIAVKPFSLVLFEPDFPQYYCNDQAGFSNDWFHFQGPELPDLVAGLGIPLNQPFSCGDIHTIRDFVRDLEMEYRFQEFHFQESINAKITAFLIQLARWHQRQASHRLNPTRAESLDRLRDVRREVLTNYHKAWSLDEMAALAKLSRSRFCALYQDFFAISPKEDLMCERLKTAQYLLSSTRSSVAEIAARVGYDNIYHFSKQFKKHYGYAPSKARVQQKA